MSITKEALLKLTARERLKTVHEMSPEDLTKLLGNDLDLIKELGKNIRENRAYVNELKAQLKAEANG